MFILQKVNIAFALALNLSQKGPKLSQKLANYLQIRTWPVFYNALSVLNLNDSVASIQK